MPRVLVVDDEEGVRSALARRLTRANFDITCAESAAEAESIIRDNPAFDTIVSDMSLEKPESGLEVMTFAFQKDMFAQVIVMTAYGSIKNAVEAMRLGAFDYIEKNAPDKDAFESISEIVGRALERRIRDAKVIATWERVASSHKP